MSFNLTTPTGWQCPVCGYVFNMGVVGCLNCNRPQHEKFKTTTTTAETPPNEMIILKTTPNCLMSKHKSCNGKQCECVCHKP